jgi:hypothetical protein
MEIAFTDSNLGGFPVDQSHAALEGNSSDCCSHSTNEAVHEDIASRHISLSETRLELFCQALLMPLWKSSARFTFHGCTHALDYIPLRITLRQARDARPRITLS